VRRTNRFIIEPADIYDRMGREQPVIVTMWHGRHFMTPFFRQPEHRVKVLISRHRDGELNTIVAERLGISTIRGSGDHNRRFDRKGGVSAFKSMLDALAEGWNVSLTADVPKVSRVAGAGVVTLARLSGRPIYPIAVTTSRRIELRNWDRSEVSLPFGRFVIVVGNPTSVSGDADDAEVERARQSVEAELNRVTERARVIADRGPRA
jgi:hypothetical protein